MTAESENKIRVVMKQNYPLRNHIVFLTSVSDDFVEDIWILNNTFFKEMAKSMPAKHSYFVTYCMLKNLTKVELTCFP